MLAAQFRKVYLDSLSNHFCSFYDDMHIYGNPQSRHCVYFIHGINGAPGQIRFALPAASRYFNNDLYVKGLLTPGFSCRNTTWDKYTRANLDERIAAIVADLVDLAARYGKVMVFCSSNGFYDFYAAFSKMDAATRSSLVLFWVACAPDQFEDTYWEHIFFRLNGFVHGGHRWVALPNNNYLSWFNPEVPFRHLCRAHKPAKYFYKHDVESRFFLYGSLWSYFSISCFNECLSYLTGHSQEKLSIPTYVMAAEHDGYWQGKGVSGMRQIIDRYIQNPVVLVRPTSHLWIAAPEHVYALLQHALGQSGERIGERVG